MYVFFLLFTFEIVESTVDVNLADLEHIANKLTPLECEKLYLYLHSPTYEVTTKKNLFLPSGFINCLESLVHWNSSPNEGLGETHAILAHRLTQIGRKDIADWLSNAVFERLSKNLNKTILGNPFKDLAEEVSYISQVYDDTNVSNSDLTLYHGEPDWETYDTVAMVVAFCFLASIFALVCELSGCCKRLKKKNKVKYLKNSRYDLVPHEEDSPASGEEYNKPETSF